MPGPYSRVYHSVKDDERFARVYPSDENFATWTRLLIEADASYPAPAAIPRSCRKRPLSVLVGAGLVDLLPNDLFRIHGMKVEREQRSEAGRVGGIASGRSRAEKTPVERTLNGPFNEAIEQNEQDKPSLDETRQDETSKAADALVAYHSLTGRFPVTRVKDWLEQLAKDYGDRAVEKALADESQVDSSLPTLLSRTQDRLALEAHEAEKRSQDVARKRAEEERKKIEEMPFEQRAANRERLAQMMVDAGLHAPKKELA